MKEPIVQIGILTEKEIAFSLSDLFIATGTYCSGVVTQQKYVKGEQHVEVGNDKIVWNDWEWETLCFTPVAIVQDENSTVDEEALPTFELKEVVIGKGFHWERKENQRFRGTLKFIVENGKLTAINIVNVETYLTSVISSEMSETASSELLKAHAVISRSWLFSNIAERLQNSREASPLFFNTALAQKQSHPCPPATGNEEEQIKWYDHESHTHFDVCADDHCQRYQGITRASAEAVKQAITDTYGQVLTFDGMICDARFSKCCGGAFEEFQYCWKEVKHPYLQKQRDFRIASPTIETPTIANTHPGSGLPDLTQEAEADRWIRTSPPAFCNTTDKRVLSQVLNNYDQETTDFYRWKVEYSQDELSKLIKERSGIDYGQIIDLVPIARGTSGRLWKLRIVGTKRTLTIGKELEIRRTLSPSHLYSSAFVVDKEELSAEGIPGRFILTGAGWGHGVGLCQIGAAVMSEQGYKYDEILKHYYIGACIEILYD